MPRLKVLFVVSECVPFAKTGGLADVAGALPIALAARGHDVRVVLPRYRSARAVLEAASRRAGLTLGAPGRLSAPSAPNPERSAPATERAVVGDYEARKDEGVEGSAASGAQRARSEAAPAVPRKLPLSIAVPVGGGDLWAGVWEAQLDAASPGAARARAYLLEHDALFDRGGVYGDSHGEFGDNLARYTFLSRGALSLCREIGFFPDVIHVHDWPTALVPIYLRTLERGTPLERAASVLTIHNLGYQGWFNKELLPITGLGWDVFHSRALEAHDSLNLLKGGLYHATAVSTVSPTYAREIQTHQGGDGLDGVLRDRGGDVVGILNGIDDVVWNPEADRHIAASYSADDLSGKRACKAALQREMGLPERPDVPLLGLISRLVTQKGIDILADALGDILSMDVQVVVLGSGETWIEDLFSRVAAASDRFRAHLGMNEGLAHRIEAGADLFLMPSRYEPCGLNQLYSQRYGTLPIVRAVGGLDDTVEADVTGFKFDSLSPQALAQTVAWAVHMHREEPAYFRSMQERAMRKPFGWSHASRQYEALYRLAVARRRSALR